MRYEDNSIHIGNDNKISDSIIGNDNAPLQKDDKRKKWYSKLFWKLIVPIAVIVIGAAICLLLNLK